MRFKVTHFLYAIIFITICSCEKEETKVNYPIKYNSTRIINNKIRIITKNGEISDNSTKQQVLDQNKEYLKDFKNINIENEIKVIYLSKDTVQISDLNSNINEIRLIEKVRDITYWKDIDTSFTLIYARFDKKINFNQFNPLFYEATPLNAVTGYSMAVKYIDCMYVLKNGKNLTIPMLDYVFKTKFGYESLIRLNNVFKEEAYKEFNENDTIIIQQYDIELVKV